MTSAPDYSLLVPTIVIGDVPPDAPSDDDLWFDTTLPGWKVWDGAEWQKSEGVVSTVEGDIDGIQTDADLAFALDGRVREQNLSANVDTWTLTPPVATDCGTVTILLRQGVGPFTVTYPAGWLWADGTPVDIGTGDGDVLLIDLQSTPAGDILASAAAFALAP